MTLTTAEALSRLADGTIEMDGLVPWGSNYTFLVTVCSDGQDPLQAIYKPRQGERPLWDFPTGSLCLREQAAFLVSEAIGWQIVPPTVLRDGPRGWGSLQLFIEHDPDETFFNFQGVYDDHLRRIALFDIFTNNADRKGGHVIKDIHDQLWGIDHGICFHPEYKLRSVIWDYAGQTIPPTELTDLEHLAQYLNNPNNELTQALQQLLNQREITALHQRLEQLIEQKRFIVPGPGRHYPWPMV